MAVRYRGTVLLLAALAWGTATAGPPCYGCAPMALLDHAFVLPAFRGQGVHGALVDARLGLAVLAQAQRVRVMANAHSFPRLVRLGFVGKGQRGGYTVMEADGVVLAGKLQSSATNPQGNAGKPENGGITF